MREYAEKEQRSRNKLKRQRVRGVKKLFFVSLCLASAFMLFGVVYILQSDAWTKFDAQRILGAPQSLLVYDAKNEPISLLSNRETRVPISVDVIPAHVIQAFLSAEDARFYEHAGVDIIRIIGAALEDIKAGSYVQGASTITQQLIKLSHLSDEKMMSRKIEEAILAYQMEKEFDKHEILEMYLNYVYFGGGFYGIEAAAKGYFGIPASELSIAQGAMLAGILKSPTRYAPHLNPEASINRRNLILRLMQEQGAIDEAQLNMAQAEGVALCNALNKDKRGYYVDLALQQACAALNISMNDLLEGGYRIYTAMDSELQAYCEELLKQDALFPENSQNVQAALVVVEAGSGSVKAIMGGRESVTALGYNRAVRIRRQPGSIIKPIISYAPALEEFGYTTVSMLLDEPTDFNGYTPSNFGEKYRGWVTLREAVMHSLNIPAVKVLSDIGLESGKRFASAVGIEFDETDDNLALALGGFMYGVSPYQIAGAYAAFATGGLYSTPSLIRYIKNANGETVYLYQPEKKRVMREENAYILTDMMQSVIKGGTGRRLLDLNIPIAGKTGTTGDSEGNRDAWMAAYNSEYAAAVWMGYDEAINGQALPASATGGTFPAMILSKLFTRLYEDRTAPDFVMPENIVEVRLDKHTLENSHVPALAGAFTPQAAVVREVFVKGSEPQNFSEYWIVPAPPAYCALVIGKNGFPVVQFMPEKSFIIYRLYRENKDGKTTLLYEFSNAEAMLEFEDRNIAPGEEYTYYIVPAHPEMEIGGREVVGSASRRMQIHIPSNAFMAENAG